MLEWRLDPSSPDCIPQAKADGFKPVIVSLSMPELVCIQSRAAVRRAAGRWSLLIAQMCNEGYASSLAAAALKELGVEGASDLDGGFRRWKQEGLPVQGG